MAQAFTERSGRQVVKPKPSGTVLVDIQLKQIEDKLLLISLDELRTGKAVQYLVEAVIEIQNLRTELPKLLA